MEQKEKEKRIRNYILAVKNNRLTDDIVDSVAFLPDRIQNEILLNAKRMTSKDINQMVLWYSN